MTQSSDPYSARVYSTLGSLKLRVCFNPVACTYCALLRVVDVGLKLLLPPLAERLSVF